jgi:putative FmdB family regulatory protein
MAMAARLPVTRASRIGIESRASAGMLERPPGAASYNFLFCVKGLAMPIYAYRCSACGHAKDVLQRLSDPVLSTCPACGAESFSKQVTAAGFQLKGSGWYATDFKGSGAAPAAAAVPAAAAAGAAGGAAAAPAAADSKPDVSAASAAPSTPCGGSCACH